MIGAEDVMTFAEKLKYRADMFEMDLNVHEEVLHIKKNMEKHFNRREYIIDLYKAKCTMAIGGNCDMRSTFFVPHDVSPLHYRQLFIDELYRLGFTDDAIELDDNDYERYHQYRIRHPLLYLRCFWRYRTLRLLLLPECSS